MIPDAQGDQVLKLRGTGPSGVAAPWLARNVIVAGGRVELTIPVAINEDRGRWRIEVTDLVSGRSASCFYVVE